MLGAGGVVSLPMRLPCPHLPCHSLPTLMVPDARADRAQGKAVSRYLFGAGRSPSLGLLGFHFHVFFSVMCGCTPDHVSCHGPSCLHQQLPCLSLALPRPPSHAGFQENHQPLVLAECVMKPMSEALHTSVHLSVRSGLYSWVRCTWSAQSNTQSLKGAGLAWVTIWDTAGSHGPNWFNSGDHDFNAQVRGLRFLVKARPSRQPEHKRPQDGGELHQRGADPGSSC